MNNEKGTSESISAKFEETPDRVVRNPVTKTDYAAEWPKNATEPEKAYWELLIEAAFKGGVNNAQMAMAMADAVIQGKRQRFGAEEEE